MFLINTEKLLSLLDNVYVSSDSKEILKQAEQIGAIPILRGENLCGDIPNIPVYQHALQYMPKDVQGIIAVQANSPTIETQKIVTIINLFQEGRKEEIMTCHPDKTIYGSVWAIRRNRLLNYGDPYNPKPDVLVIDDSIDIHTQQDYELVLQDNLLYNYEYEKDTYHSGNWA